MSLEADFRSWLDAHKVAYLDNTDSTTEVDFALVLGETTCPVDTKEKLVSYKEKNWPPSEVAIEDRFILDELGIRKVLAWGLCSAIVVRNNVTGTHHLYTGMDLLTMPHEVIERQVGDMMKGKWVVALSNASASGSLDDVMDALKRYTDRFTALVGRIGLYRRYGRDVPRGGWVRTPAMRQQDFATTR